MVISIEKRVDKQAVSAELESIRLSNDGILRAKDIVDRAKAEDNILHNHFEWDDTIAGYSYRLWQARQLIKVIVVTVPNFNEPILAYVSLKTDRYFPEGGYRAIVDVLSDTEKREQLLQEALADYELWERKYRQLEELIPIFRVAKKIKVKTAKH